MKQPHQGVRLAKCPVDFSGTPSVRDARLIAVSGSGALQLCTDAVPDLPAGTLSRVQICLNGLPLVQAFSNGCPTCEGLLEAGYGREQINCTRMNEIREAVNAPFRSLEDAAERLAPLLTLLESGLYVLTDAVCFPTDGRGTFFWNLPFGPASYPTMSDLFLPDWETSISGQPVYLYPSQNTDCFQETRVRHYLSLFHSGVEPPRAVALHLGGFLNLLLDGHHKACAAALLHQPVPVLLILPYSGKKQRKRGNRWEESLMFSSAEIPAEQIPKDFLRMQMERPERLSGEPLTSLTGRKVSRRKWEAEYLKSALAYPLCEEYAKILLSDISWTEPVPEEMVTELLNIPKEENQPVLQAVLTAMKRQHDPRLKRTAISCIQQFPGSRLAVSAFCFLTSVRPDTEVEQFLIDYLINHEDENDINLLTIHGYWN